MDHTASGHPLRAASAAPHARIHRRRGARAGARHRRDDGDFHACSIGSSCGRCRIPTRIGSTMVWETNDSKGLTHERISPVNFGDYRALSQVFEDAAGWWYPQLNAHRDRARSAARQRDRDERATSSTCSASSRSSARGSRRRRSIRARSIAVISHRLWRERFGGDPVDRRQDRSRSTVRSSPSSA